VPVGFAVRHAAPPAYPTIWRPPRYCELPKDNVQTACRSARCRAASGEFEGDDHDPASGDRPLSRAIASTGFARQAARRTTWHAARAAVAGDIDERSYRVSLASIPAARVREQVRSL
jgi:hypothetical protein